MPGPKAQTIDDIYPQMGEVLRTAFTNNRWRGLEFKVPPRQFYHMMRNVEADWAAPLIEGFADKSARPGRGRPGDVYLGGSATILGVGWLQGAVHRCKKLR